MPGDVKPKVSPRCPQCGAQLPNPANAKNPLKGRFLSCPACNFKLTGGEPMNYGPTPPGKINAPGMQVPNIISQVAFDDITMPTNKSVVKKPMPGTMTRRVKRENISLSDEYAENIDKEHLSNCCESAQDLEIDG